MTDIKIETDEKKLQIRTRVFLKLQQQEIVLRVDGPELLGEAENLLHYIVQYLTTGPRIKTGETLAYGYWLIKFKLSGENLLEVYEYNKDASELKLGVSLVLKYWRDQHLICDKYKAQFSPPRPDQLVVISEGVLEGKIPLQGVRYPSPEHMSGWWLTTDLYDGNIQTLKTIHMNHLTAKRDDISALIALPFGYRFEIKNGVDVWFEEEVASQPME